MSLIYDELSIQEAIELLRKWRECNERRSEEIMEIWECVLGEDLSKCGNEKHVLLEQVVLAALDCHCYGVANYCICLLYQQFPGSARVRRLNAALLQAQGKHAEALEQLDELIKEDETNAGARKRRVAVVLCAGRDGEREGGEPAAARELVDYLKKFSCDVEAWQQVCELYCRHEEYARAAFCCEELLLHQPHHHLLHQRLADIRYTMGGVENLELAKSYYAQALRLNADNARAVLGLLLTCNSLMQLYRSGGGGGGGGAGGGRRAHVSRVQRHAARALAALHARARAPHAHTQPLLLALAVGD